MSVDPKSLLPFPDVQVALMDWLEDTFPSQLSTIGTVRRVASEPAANLALLLRSGGYFATVDKIDGDDDEVTDYSVVDLDVYAARRDDAHGLAEGIRARLLRYPHRVGTASPVLIGRVITETAPRRLPWADEDVHRIGSTYRISARR